MSRQMDKGKRSCPPDYHHRDIKPLNEMLMGYGSRWHCLLCTAYLRSKAQNTHMSNKQNQIYNYQNREFKLNS